MPIDTGGPAFPVMTERQQLSENDNYVTVREPEGGMTLRDYFAAKALPSVLAARVAAGNDISQESIAEECFELADAMIVARHRESDS